jgi:hypothetical protein
VWRVVKSYKNLIKIMELFSILKIILIIGVVIALYAIARNLDIIKIILIYWKDLILKK